MVERAEGGPLTVRKDLTMFHTVLCVDTDKSPIAVRITTNPLDHPYYAQVVMHKTRSHGCAVQVARYVRRRFDIEDAVQTHRTPRAVEAMIGYACTRTAQYPPTDKTPGWGVFQHIAATPIRDLLKEVADGHNASRTRYVVYEVRSGRIVVGRGVTHRYDALERRYREAPPDTWPNAEVFQIGRFASMEEANKACFGSIEITDKLWTRHPPALYVLKVLIATPNDILWTCDRTSAVRDYDFRAVCIGPHVYTEFQVRHLIEHGVWVDGRTLEGRRIKVLGHG